ncbi:MAG: ParB/RepB/Spo0J family partition protein [Candidatus Heimdallarchaeaceae archaeon]
MEIKELPVNKIIPSVFQPRETFDKGELQELAGSMKEHGLINPISVRENGDGTYQIIAGERRWRASKFAKMDKIYAIIRDVTDEQQRLESLIENVHRKDLNMIEKGRGMMEIFKIRGIDMKPKNLALKIRGISSKLDRNLELGSEEEKILKTYSKTHIEPNTIRIWLESISADEKVIKDHLKTLEEERIPEKAIARLSTIEDKDLQKKTYAKIKEQQMSAPKASKFVSTIKKAPKKEQEAFLTPGISVDVVGDQEVGYEIEVPEEEIEKLRHAVAKGQKKTAEILSQDIVRERGKHRRNWQSHNQLLTVMDNVFCPYCGKDSSHLRWSCHPNYSIEEVKEEAKHNYEDSTKREEPDYRFLTKEK